MLRHTLWPCFVVLRHPLLLLRTARVHARPAAGLARSCWQPLPTTCPLARARRAPCPAVSRASVSEHGPAVMGYSDMLQRTMSAVAAWAVM